ncbi:hypothetical protein, partial [Mesorhizobium sp. M0898]|uniref:hypothetical protein n=2 Tax=unclassified Mesorhizobium TaxID=325217 RepID=UPI003334B53C
MAPIAGGFDISLFGPACGSDGLQQIDAVHVGFAGCGNGKCGGLGYFGDVVAADRSALFQQIYEFDNEKKGVHTISFGSELELASSQFLRVSFSPFVHVGVLSYGYKLLTLSTNGLILRTGHNLRQLPGIVSPVARASVQPRMRPTNRTVRIKDNTTASSPHASKVLVCQAFVGRLRFE